MPLPDIAALRTLVPVFFEGDDEAGLEGSAGSDGGCEGDEFCREVLRFDRAGAAVANARELRVGRGCRQK